MKNVPARREHPIGDGADQGPPSPELAGLDQAQWGRPVPQRRHAGRAQPWSDLARTSPGDRQGGATADLGRLGFVYYVGRILAVDAPIALRAGSLITVARAKGISVAIEDALIAATADLRFLTVLTDNERHFAPMGVAWANPLRSLPPDAV